MNIRSLPEPLLAVEPATDALLEPLARIDSLRDRWCAARDSGQVLPNVLESVRIDLTYHSNAIEGNTLSLRETQLVIEGVSPPAGKTMRELYEARNHDRALRTIETWVTQPRGAVSERDLLEVHAILLADIDPHAGQYRSHRVLIAGTGFVPPGAQKFPQLMPAVFELANRPGVHAVVQAAELHYNLVAVHPFGDGNGRAARLMMNYLLLRSGLPHTIIEVGRRSEYLAALDEANAGRWERFAQFIADCVERSAIKILGE